MGNNDDARREALRKKTEQNASQKGQGRGVLDLAKVKGEVKFFKPKVGYNTIDIIPFEVKTENIPGLEKGSLEYVLNIWTHRRIGPSEETVLCLKRTCKKACPICEAMDEIKEENPDFAEALAPKNRAIYNVISLDGEDESVMIFETSYYNFEKELLEEAKMDADEIVCFSDPIDGKSVKFRAVEETFKKSKYFEFKKFSFEDRERPYKMAIVDETFALDALLKVPSYEEVQALLNGASESSAEPKQETTRRSSRYADEPSEAKQPEKSKEEEAPRRRREEEPKAPKEQKNACPSNHMFGKDTDEFEECASCSIWESCADEQAKNRKGK